MISRSPSPEFSPLAIGEDLTPLPVYKAPSTTSIDFSSLLDPPLLLHEDLKSGCGGQLWPAGMVLAQQMLRYHKSSLKDARMYVHTVQYRYLTFIYCHVLTQSTDLNLELVVDWLAWELLLGVILRSQSILLTKKTCWNSWQRTLPSTDLTHV